MGVQMGEIYLEIVPVDKASLRVTAIDPETGLEVVFAAPSYTARERINKLATDKLRARVLREKQQTAQGLPKPTPERGKLV